MNILKRGFAAVLFIALCFLSVIFACQTEISHGASLPSASGRVTASDGVNIRKSYSTSSDILGAIPYSSSISVKGEKFTVSGDKSPDTIWYNIDSAYGSGYIRSDLASVSYSAYAAGTTTDALNVRDGAGTSFADKGTLAKGTSVKVAGAAEAPNGSSWYKIYLDGEYLYVSASYVSLSGGSSPSNPSGDADFEKQLEAENFPESYRVFLRALHEKYPNWKFKANHVGYSFSEALEKQLSDTDANLVSVSFPDAFKMIKGGTYNFDTHSYIAKDGDSWVTASRAAVAYYMDPRNWLTEDSVFMFEDLTYDPSVQTEAIVQKILSTTAMPSNASSYFMAAASQYYNGKTYSVSPVYLAAKSRVELGSSDFMINGHSFTYGGKTYSGFYNAYNIGAVDSPDGSAALKGLVYAAGGADGTATSYLRPWNTLEKAVKGGGLYIAQNYISNNQHTSYYERFNVLNGYNSIGTHQYQTSVFAAATQGQIVYENYRSFGVLDEGFTFDIPVYEDMPEEISARPPSTGNNNCYLDDIRLYADGKELAYTPEFNRFTGTYTVNTEVPSSVNKLTIETDKNADDSTVTVSGNSLSYGENRITVKCTSSSGLVSKYYYFNVTREQGTGDYVPETPENLKAENLGGNRVKLTWTGDSRASGYQINYKRSSLSKWYSMQTTSTTYTKDMATEGILYDFRVRAFYENENGEKIYSAEYSDTVSQASFGKTGTLSGSLNKETMTASLSWTETKGADGYTVYFRPKGGNSYQSVDTEKLSFTQKIDSSVSGYEYYVIPYMLSGGERFYSGSPSNTVSLSGQSTGLINGVENTTISASASTGSGYIRLDWRKSAGYKMDVYEIFRSEDPNDFGTAAYFTTKSGGISGYYKNTKELKKGVTYYYKIRGKRLIDGKTYYSRWSDVVSVTYGEITSDPEPNQGIINGVKNTTIKASSTGGAGYIRVSWTKSAGYKVDCYEIFRSTKRDSGYGTEAYFTTKSGGMSGYYKNTKGLVKGTRYYYKVRGVREINGKTYYTKWSSLAYRVAR